VDGTWVPGELLCFPSHGAKQTAPWPAAVCHSPLSWTLCCVTSDPSPVSSFQGSGRLAVGSVLRLASRHQKPRRGSCTTTAASVSQICPPWLTSLLTARLSCQSSPPCPQQAQHRRQQMMLFQGGQWDGAPGSLGQADGCESRGWLSQCPASPKSRSLPSGTTATPGRRAQVNTSNLFYSIPRVRSHSAPSSLLLPGATLHPKVTLRCHHGCKCSGTSCSEQRDTTQTFPSASRSSPCCVPPGQLSTARTRQDPAPSQWCGTQTWWVGQGSQDCIHLRQLTGRWVWGQQDTPCHHHAAASASPRHKNQTHLLLYCSPFSCRAVSKPSRSPDPLRTGDRLPQRAGRAGLLIWAQRKATLHLNRFPPCKCKGPSGFE